VIWPVSPCNGKHLYHTTGNTTITSFQKMGDFHSSTTCLALSGSLQLPPSGWISWTLQNAHWHPKCHSTSRNWLRRNGTTNNKTKEMSGHTCSRTSPRTIACIPYMCIRPIRPPWRHKWKEKGQTYEPTLPWKIVYPHNLTKLDWDARPVVESKPRTLVLSAAVGYGTKEYQTCGKVNHLQRNFLLNLIL
jgi:hypothetical protein